MSGSFRSYFGMSLAVLALLLFAGSLLPVLAQAVDAPTVMVAKSAKLGSILTDSKGMTLYAFKKDKPGESACVDNCAKNWPPLTIAEGTQPMAGSGIPGKLGQIERKDDTYQVTYNGMPLYHFAGDSKPGDTNGQGMGGVWSAVSTSTSSTASASGGSSKGW